MRLPRTIGIVLVLGILFVSTPAWSQKPVYGFKGGVGTRAETGITMQELKPLPQGGGFFSWTYTFVMVFDDGSSATIQFTYSKMYMMKRRGCYLSFVDPSGTIHLRKGLYSATETGYAENPPNLKMGPHSWSGFYPEFRVVLNFPLKDTRVPIKADLRFKCRTPGWRPGEGPVHYGTPDGDWYDLMVMIPWADIKGELTINGKTRKLAGWGYADYNTRVVKPSSQMTSLMALRSFSEENAVHFMEHIAPEEYGHASIKWIIIMKGDRILFATDKWERKLAESVVVKKRDLEYPSRVSITIDRPDCKLTGEITGTRAILSSRYQTSAFQCHM